jgi:hypothetical protein
MLSSSVNDHSVFRSAVAFEGVDMVSAKGITADGRRDLILGYASPGIEPQHSVSFFGFGLKPLEFSVACIIVVFGWASGKGVELDVVFSLDLEYVNIKTKEEFVSTTKEER